MTAANPTVTRSTPSRFALWLVFLCAIAFVAGMHVGIIGSLRPMPENRDVLVENAVVSWLTLKRTGLALVFLLFWDQLSVKTVGLEPETGRKTPGHVFHRLRDLDKMLITLLVAPALFFLPAWFAFGGHGFAAVLMAAIVLYCGPLFLPLGALGRIALMALWFAIGWTGADLFGRAMTDESTECQAALVLKSGEALPCETVIGLRNYEGVLVVKDGRSRFVPLADIDAAALGKTVRWAADDLLR
ncbi:hypothetical protein GAO09_16940 [Rhizobiales bacterium RZME27]|uniref:Uncharacterized protein n=1 Tax=Endobacterium cereale TaxID=2663029 RepID=A0A6A8AAJ7_9HYPH|nr:hypothetical protein [Endobacterium cereale]MEB2846855.1 hypothetical protein [Endobacterium cereale]MQY47724.1 hypothetical protein [Endobacterium cereale]